MQLCRVERTLCVSTLAWASGGPLPLFLVLLVSLFNSFATYLPLSGYRLLVSGPQRNREHRLPVVTQNPSGVLTTLQSRSHGRLLVSINYQLRTRFPLF